MNNFFKENRYVLGTFAVVWALSVVFQAFVPKSALHLFLNRFHAPFFDLFFKYLTWLGSGWTVVAIILIMLFRHARTAVVFLMGNLLNTGIVQGMKNYLFSGVLRPAGSFKDVQSLYLVPGVDMNIHYSFPSGHSATAFGIFVIMILLSKKQWQKFLWLFAAMLTAYSRVYLSQHFFQDILAGSFIGTAGMLFVIWLFRAYLWKEKRG